MDNETPGTSRDHGGRNLRPKRKLNDADIAAMIHEMDGFDVSDLELSDDDDITDKTYEPIAVQEYDDDDPEVSIAPEESELSYQTSMSSDERTRWKIRDNFGTEFAAKQNEPNECVRSPLSYLEEYLPDSIYESITLCTNQRGLVLGKSFNLKNEEVKRFIGLNLYMFVMRAPSSHGYVYIGIINMEIQLLFQQ